MTSIEISAPAKVNLFLRVLGKRKDGYHDILTVFERITLEDRIKISKSPSGIKLLCSKPITKDPRDNLAYKAAQAILAHKKSCVGVKIEISKHIPIAAGLGGGSSDAAAVLTGINKLCGMKLSKKELMRLGARLGADVPFFIFDAAFAAGKGIGNELSIIRSNTRFWHLLVYPGFEVSTKEVYRDFKRPVVRQAHHPLNHPELSPRGLTIESGNVKIRPLGFLFHNDLQAMVVRKRPVMGEILKRLANLSGAEAIVSGSGPSVFCLYETRREAMSARRRLFKEVPATRRKRWQVFVTATRF